MKKTILAVITIMIIQTTIFGWHESFSTDATPAITGAVNSDMSWTWWGWGGVEVSGGELMLTVPDPGTDPFDNNSCWLQIDQSTDANAPITPTDSEIWIKLKISTTGTPTDRDQFHVAIAIDPNFLTNLNVYTAAVSPVISGVGSYYFQLDQMGGPVINDAIVYNQWFWKKIVTKGDTVSVWAFADGSAPTDTAQFVFTTDNVTDPAPMLVLVGVFDDDSSALHIDDVYYNESPPLGIDDNASIAKGFELNQNYPNPFNPVTHINYTIPEIGPVKLAVFNVLGKEVSTLVNMVVTPGTHSAVWDAGDMPSGVYFYRIEAGSFTQTRKLLLIK
ncbi:MAG: T9SS type A sorting domain-containing protein [Fidelibacterota bacterium]